MSLRRIVHYGHPILRAEAEPVDAVNASIQNLIKDMWDTLQTAEGIGLAAPQIGVAKQVFIAYIKPSETEAERFATLINPRILELSGDSLPYTEGCLSFPGVWGTVYRPDHVLMEGLDLHGNRVQVDASGLWGRVLQHEFDHLHGNLFIDYFSAEERETNQALIDKILRKNKRKGDTTAL